MALEQAKRQSEGRRATINQPGPADQLASNPDVCAPKAPSDVVGMKVIPRAEISSAAMIEFLRERSAHRPEQSERDADRRCRKAQYRRVCVGNACR